jgi:hypothetical protein
VGAIGWIAVLAAVTTGAVVQGSIGFGLNVVAAPLAVLVEPDMVPGPLLVTAFTIAAAVSVRDRAALDLRAVGWALAGRVPGVIAGTWALSHLSSWALQVMLGSMVLAAAVVSAAGWSIRRTPRSEMGVGAISGFTGTTTSIGGPPMALLYQHDAAARLRANLSGFLVVGTAMSIGLLAVAGEFGRRDLQLGLPLVPAVLVGFAMSRRCTPWLDRGYSRPVVLVASALGALAVLARALL